VAVEATRRGRIYGGKAAEARSHERRERLIAAGVELFGTQGYSATTVRHVCTEAGLTERYFYESFENREELFVAVASECVTGLVDAIVRARAHVDDTPDEQIRAMLTAYFEWFKADARRARIQLFEPLLISPRFHELYRDVVSLFVAMIADIATRFFAEAIAIRGLDATLLATGLAGAATELVKEWAVSGYARPVDDLVRNAGFLFTSTIDVAEGRD